MSAPPPASQPPDKLRRHRPFLLLCADQAAGSVGRQITALALPLVAIARLHAGPLGAAALMALTYLPGAVLSPFVGLLVDRARLRRLAVVLTCLQAVVLATVPAADAVHRLGWPQLYSVALVTGTLTMTLTVTLQAMLPRVVPSELLLEANVAMSGARTVGQIGGPALGGLFIALFGTSQAILGDCAAYVVEAAVLLLLPLHLDTPAEQADQAEQTERTGQSGLSGRSRWEGLRGGFDVIAGDRLLRRQAGAAAGINLGGAAAGSLFVLYATRNLSLPSWKLGTIFAVYAAASAAGVVLSRRVARAVGLGRASQYCALGAAAALYLIPAASIGLAFPVLIAYQILFGIMATIWAVSMTTARQLATPAHLQGRVAAFLQAALTGTIPIGALVGGAVAEWTGIVPVLVAAAVVATFGALGLSLPRGLHAQL